MNKSFFLKRGLEFQLRLENKIEKQYAELALGVSGEIDSQSGMIMNLSELSQIFENYRSQIRGESFLDAFDFLEKARKTLSSISIFEFHHQSLGRDYILRLEADVFNLHISGFIQSEKFHIESEIKNSAELLTTLRWLHQSPTFEDMTQVRMSFSHVSQKFQLKRENLISGRTFLESWD